MGQLPDSDVMTTRAFGGTVVFCGLFGVLFLWIGIRRMLSAIHGPKRAEHLFWGTVGVVIGIAFFAAIAWLLMPVSDADKFRP